jgi:flagellin
MEVSMTRLSTGKRINSGADDAAGVAIANRMTGILRSTQQAMRNVADGISYADTAEGTLDEMANMVIRMRELYTQSGVGTLSAADSNNISIEIAALSVALTTIVTATTWAGTDITDISIKSDAAGTIFSLSGSLLAAPTGITSYATAESALEVIATARATLGSQINVMNNLLNNLTNYAANLGSSIGTIEDADFAAETTNMVKMQVLQQAATAMLAQANQSKQNILQLIQG